MTGENKPASPPQDEISNQAHRDGPTMSQGGGTFEIKLSGHLDAHWSERLGDMAIQYDNKGNTLLTGMIPDQAALHGILTQIRDLGLSLIWLKPSGVDE